MTDLTVRLLGMELKNPLILASGVLGESMDVLRSAVLGGAGCLVTKSLTCEPREGYRGPTLIEPEHGAVLNAMGLPNPGLNAFLQEYSPLIDDVPVIPSLYGTTGELIEMAGAFEDSGAPAVEVNLSCPHGPGVKRAAAQSAGHTRDVLSELTSSLSLPVIAKLSPNVTDIVEIADAAISGGASAIAACNTFEALEVDPHFLRPSLGNPFGGLSGPCIRPLVQRKIADITLAMSRGELERRPIIAIGGVTNGFDVARYLLLGATAVGIGTAVLYRDLSVFSKVCVELSEYMASKGLSCLREFAPLSSSILSWIENVVWCKER